MCAFGLGSLGDACFKATNAHQFLRFLRGRFYFYYMKAGATRASCMIEFGTKNVHCRAQINLFVFKLYRNGCSSLKSLVMKVVFIVVNKNIELYFALKRKFFKKNLGKILYIIN